MAEIKGTGRPDRTTVGAIGDIYTDIKTGNRYKCTFAYRTGDNGSFDCEWKHIGTKPLEKVEKKEPVKEPQKHVEEKPQVSVPPKRRDYSSYSKNNK